MSLGVTKIARRIRSPITNKFVTNTGHLSTDFAVFNKKGDITERKYVVA